MLPIRPPARILDCNWNHFRKLHVYRPAPTLRTLAPPTKKPNARNISTSRIQQVAKHLNPSIPGSTSEVDMSRYSVRKIGPANTLEHRIFIEKDGVPISAFHDIPLYANEQQTVLNMIVEIPRWTNGKLEVSDPLPIARTCLDNYNYEIIV